MRYIASLVCLAACATAPIDQDTEDDPNAGLLRDFLDGKFDGAGHPINARVIDAETLCGSQSLGATCTSVLPGTEQHGDMQVNARIRVRQHGSGAAILTIRLRDSSGTELAVERLTVSRLRNRTSWIDLPVGWTSAGEAVTIELVPAPGAAVELEYIEVFPKHFGLVMSPGSGVIADSDRLVFELPRYKKVDRLTLDGVEITQSLQQLITSGKATRTTTNFRTVIDVGVGDLLPDRAEVSELRLVAGNDASRLQLRTSAAACNFEGDASGTRVLVTGFHPFPADGWHENVSAVAVTAMDPANIPGAQVMRLVLPVEYDRAAAAITELIERCNPDVVISFGQGGSAIALEEVAYNLQDTGEVSGGVPDNRGIVRAAAPIDLAAAAERDTLLPLAAIESALEAIGEAPRHSRDPGRYICNNVFFVGAGVMASRGGRAGFIHLPYTTSFDDSVRARFGAIVEAAIQATIAR